MSHLWKLYPSATGTMQPKIMPVYRGLKVHPPKYQPTCASYNIERPGTLDNTVDTEIDPLLSAIKYDNSRGHHFSLQKVPIITGYFTSDEQRTCSHIPIYKHSVSVLDSSLIRYSFVVCGFNSGHFKYTTSWHCLPFKVVIATDTWDYCCDLFKQFTQSPTVTTSVIDLLVCLQA